MYVDPNSEKIPVYSYVEPSSFKIDWDKFKNTIIVTNTEGTKKISTRIFEVIEYSQK